MTDDDGFHRFVESESDGLRRLAYLLTGNAHEAEEMTQESLVRTYLAWKRIRRGERPALYARSVLVNQHRSILRRGRIERRRLETLSAIGRGDINRNDDSIATDDAIVLWQALKDMPWRYRVTVTLRFYEDLSTAQIAAVMDCPEGTVRSLLHRGLARMRANLGEDVEKLEAEAK